MVDESDALQQLPEERLAALARSAVDELARRGSTSGFRALTELSAYVGVRLGEAARAVAEQTSWTHVGELSGTTKQAAWSRWHWS
ncbi:MAG TPA: hypothetical protein VFP34_04845 [Microlunatus sp.]|nr:hypothetical protein [Microlunatus sp.]